MENIKDQYYIALSPKGEDRLVLVPSAETSDRGYHYKKQKSGETPFSFENSYRSRDRNKWPVTEVLFSAGDILVNDFISDELKKYETKGLQLYPSVYIDDDDNWHENYSFLIFYESADFLDKEKSFPETKGNKQLAGIEQYVLDEQKLKLIPEDRRLIFKISEEYDSQIFFHERIVRFLEENNVQGIYFVKPSEFREGDQYQFSTESDPEDYFHVENRDFRFDADEKAKKIKVEFFKQNTDIYEEVLELLLNFIGENPKLESVDLSFVFAEELPYLESNLPQNSLNQFLSQALKHRESRQHLYRILEHIESGSYWLEGEEKPVTLGTLLSLALALDDKEDLYILTEWLKISNVEKDNLPLSFLEELYAKYHEKNHKEVMGILVSALVSISSKNQFSQALLKEIFSQEESLHEFFRAIINYQNDARAKKTEVNIEKFFAEVAPAGDHYEQFLKFSEAAPANQENKSFTFNGDKEKESIEVTFLEQSEEIYAQVLDLIINFLKTYALDDIPEMEFKFTREMPYLSGTLKKISASQFFAEAVRYPALHKKLTELFDIISSENSWLGEAGRYKNIDIGSFLAAALAGNSAEHLEILYRWFNTLNFSYNAQDKDLSIIEEVFDKYHGSHPQRLMDIIVLSLSISYFENFFPKAVHQKIIADENLLQFFFEALFKYEYTNQENEYAITPDYLVGGFFPNYRVLEKYLIFKDEYSRKHPGAYKIKTRKLNNAYERLLASVMRSRIEFAQDPSPGVFTVMSFLGDLNKLLNLQVNENSIHLAEELQQDILDIGKEHEKRDNILLREYVNGFTKIALFYIEQNKPAKAEEQLEMYVEIILRNEANYALAAGALEIMYELLSYYNEHSPEKMNSVLEKAVRIANHCEDKEEFNRFFSEYETEADIEFARIQNADEKIIWEPNFLYRLQAAVQYHYDIADLAEMVFQEFKELEKSRASDKEQFEFLKKWVDLVVFYYKLENFKPINTPQKLIQANFKNLLNSFLIAAFDIKNIKDGVAFADKIQDISHINNYIYHSAACLYAANEEYDKAMKQCQLAKEYGYPHMDSLKTDTDLEELFERKEFQEL